MKVPRGATKKNERQRGVHSEKDEQNSWMGYYLQILNQTMTTIQEQLHLERMELLSAMY